MIRRQDDIVAIAPDMFEKLVAVAAMIGTDAEHALATASCVDVLLDLHDPIRNHGQWTQDQRRARSDTSPISLEGTLVWVSRLAVRWVRENKAKRLECFLIAEMDSSKSERE